MIRRRAEIRGVVQGVGFRPFVYSLAARFGLAGHVLNSGFGVEIEVEGPAGSVDRFFEALAAGPPPLARIESTTIGELPPVNDREFEIRESAARSDALALVPPDIAACEACEADFRDARNRRHAYPFTNCTNCGPRYTIIEDVPYDRPLTTMSEFAMCADCEREYHNPADRRFHAQPNACPVCGPWVELWDHGRCLASRGEAIAATQRLLREGAICGIKGLGGFHLACDALSETAVARLRERKRRSAKPFAVMASGLSVVERSCFLSDPEREALLSPRRPIVILRRRPECRMATECAPGNHTLGVLLPYTPLHSLLTAGFEALVMTSGNVSEEPIVSRNDELPSRLHPICDFFLVHNRRIQTRVDDSVVRLFEGSERLIRRSRGYAPHPLALPFEMRPALAVGGELKSTFCLTRERYAVMSQHIGDLENYETLVFFRETLEHMKRFFRIQPEIVAHDLHPGYLSTRLALEMTGVEHIGVQHHHAHVAACAAENGLEGAVCGVAFDGTGYGTDGQIWGGEFLVCDGARFERAGHFRPVAMPGGDQAVREPWRMAVAYLRDAGLDSAHPRAKLIGQMIESGIHTVMTSSCGRLFDAVASIAGLRDASNFEGQAASELESAAAGGYHDPYPYRISPERSVDFRPMIESVATGGEAAPVIAARFHRTLAAATVEMCRLIGVKRVCLTGGCFQNWLLLEQTAARLRSAGFEVFLHRRVPPNDGGLALGQAAIAARLR